MKNPMYRLALLATMASTFLINVPLYASGTDDRIESTVKETYVFKTYLRGDNIKMQSKDGLVTLTGTVSEASHISLAGETVAGLPGVKRVDNKLVEKDGTPAVKSDAWLITKVKTTLLFHSNVNATGTEVLALKPRVNTEKGVVTLEGNATTAATKDLAGKFASDVGGVKKVIDNMSTK